ncbi:hypothetical protein CTI12_AA361840 [Artemisia annua]|uniref:Uncharacterized protein n=1 Tax=Artemisia annua TaxID=35608 RepID=A0A2U1MMR2_ARTAN|nr:hypothetical protein CTI12_AA361840 [Artemisia annua]
MAFYVDEEDIWKCSKHPSKRRRSGICPTCLRDRLIELCPECANKRPCSCDPHLTDSTSSSSSNSSSFHVFHFSRAGSLRDGQGEIGRVSNLIENEPAFRRSRSLAIPFLRSRSRYVTTDRENDHAREKRVAQVSRSKIRFWSIFRSKKCDLHGGEDDHESNKSDVSGLTEDYSNSRMMRSKSVAVSSSRGAGDHGFSPVKHKKWYFPSPLKAFRQAKRSPLHRG